MKGKNKYLRVVRLKNLLFLLALVSLVCVLACWKLGGGERKIERNYRSFVKELHTSMNLLEEEFSFLLSDTGSATLPDRLNSNSLRYQEWANQEGIAIFYFENGELSYWSDNSITLRSRRHSGQLSRDFVSLRNADYVSVRHREKDSFLVGLVEVRSHYPIQNKYLKNNYHSKFGLDPGVKLLYFEEDGCLPVYAADGTYLFSLDFRDVYLKDGGASPFALAFMFLSLVLLLMAMFTAVRTAGKRKKIYWFWSYNLLLMVLLLLFFRTEFSFIEGLGNMSLFQPELFASKLFPSLGHLGIFTMAVLGLSLNIYYNAPWKSRPGKYFSLIRALIYFILAAVLILLVEHLLQILVLDSGISFEPHRITTMSVHSMLGMLLVMCWFLVIGLVLDRAITCMKGGWIVFLSGSITFAVVFALARLLNLGNPCWLCLSFAAALLGSQIYLRFRNPGRIPFSRMILVTMVLTVFLLIRLLEFNEVKLERQKEVELVKYASEHDPVAEMLFESLSETIRGDSLLAGFIYPDFVDIDPLASRLQRNYFSGYWTKYEFQVVVCRPTDDLYLNPPEDRWLHCYSYFEEVIRTQGMEISGSDFHFMDSPDGRISYLGAIPYRAAGEDHIFFITLYSKTMSEELGYPELLLDEKYSSFTRSDFSYARYYRGELVNEKGDYAFRRSPAFYTSGEETFEKLRVDEWDLSIYNRDGETTVIVGSPVVSQVDRLISFAYLFVFIYLLVALVYILTDLWRPGALTDRSFKHRIQYSMVIILFLSFAMICSGTVFFIIRQYSDKDNDNMRNTMRSVYIELVHKVEYEADLANWSSEKYYNLDELLRKFSNVFYSDINLYDPEGIILATSREEIFTRHLLSPRMNRLVYEKLTSGAASVFIHKEHIGGLVYTSAYVPLLNSENQLLAYLNLPYFTQSELLTQDVTNMVVAVVNLYLILLLVLLGLSVILADRITQPLRVLQSRIAHVSLSEKNEILFYERNDEIRGLVEEYNFMVQELERSAAMLARSERESAWREMAKQIAHEIKNPLTPMKLNVQHLQRTMEEGKSDPEMVARISTTLIEQIDSLSAIANEFSDFAKMPRARSEKVDLVSKLGNLLDLFDVQERTQLSLDAGSLEEVWVLADREQLMRVFINLVKNGLQSIPKEREGRISIVLEVEGGEALVSFSDNGKGIPEEIRDKLFRPNFTTKSAGMGMGLAICSNIVKSLGGSIWYKTVKDEGTTFFVSLPLMVEKS